MITTVFYFTLFAGSSLSLLMLATAVSKEIKFWPPPSGDSWQYKTFWGLFRLMFLGIVILSILDFDTVQSSTAWWRYFLGAPLAIIGFTCAFYATIYLGWKNAHGEKAGLQTNGWYRWSRNPVYVVSIVGIVGLGLLVNSARLWPVLLLWIIFYLITPFLEEPWLEKQYGADYLAYKKRVPRFVGFVKK